MKINERENKQEICDKLLEALRATRAAGIEENNDLVELRYIKDDRREIVRPIFRDGCGKDGYYDVNVAGDSGVAVIMDVVKQFVRKMW